MNRAERRRAEREASKQPTKASFPMSVVDLSEVKDRAERRAATPPWNAGTPTVSMQVGIVVGQNGPSFTEACERAAYNLSLDGWRVLEVVSMVLLGVNQVPGENGVTQNVAGFELTLKIAPLKKADEDANA